MDKPKIIVIMGPTASGKTDVAVKIAMEFDGEIINADSMQVYRRMDIGTAKPTPQERAKVPHHLIDVRDPDENFDAAVYRQEAAKAVYDIRGRGRLPVIAGGTGLYIKTLLGGIFGGPGADPEIRERLNREAEEYGTAWLYDKLSKADPETAGRIDPFNPRRIIRALEVFYNSGVPLSVLQRGHAFSESEFLPFKIGLRFSRESLYKRIDGRVESMIERGLIDEVRRLREMGYSPVLKSMQSIGYSQVCDFLDGRYSLEEMTDRMKTETRHYAKRQMTWFSRDAEILWFNMEEEGVFGRILSEVRGFIGRS